MQALPLYTEPPRAAIELENPLSLDSQCVRCSLSASKTAPKTICMPADGAAGGVLIIGEAPGRTEDSAGRPFIGTSGAFLRQLVDVYYKGPVAYEYAVGCYPGQNNIPTPGQVNACRPYAAQTIVEAKPERIICVGGTAVASVFGKSIPVASVRRGYGFLSNGTPVFLLLHPTTALRNRFMREWFESDLKWALTCELPTPDWDGIAILVDTANGAIEAYKELCKAEWVAFDCETFGLLWEPDFKLLSIALTGKDQNIAWVWSEQALNNDKTCDPLKVLLLDEQLPKVGQNIKFDLQAIKCGMGIQIPRQVVGLDTRLLRKLTDAEAAANLETMAYLVGAGGHKDEAQDWLNKALGQTKAAKDYRAGCGAYGQAISDAYEKGVDPKAYAFATIPHKTLHTYNALDTWATAKLAAAMETKLNNSPEMSHIWGATVGKASAAIARVEEWGVLVDVGAIKLFGDHLRTEQANIRSRIAEHGDFDPASPKQLRHFLFDVLGLPPVKFSKKTGEASTDADVLKQLEGKHPVVDMMLQERHITKLLGTYADGADGKSGMLQYVRRDGRIHTNYNIDGARSGRLSSDGPNLQNIPRPENAEGIMARSIFVVPEGYSLVSFDFSQLEYRVAAFLSGDPEMIRIINAGIDFHEGTARIIAPILWKVTDWDALDSALKKKYRTIAKTINFALLYGMTDETLAKKLGVSVGMARKIRETVLGKFAVFAVWSRTRIEEVVKTGYCWTWWDGMRARRRPMHAIADPEPSVRLRAEHGAVNSPVQGTASEFCLASLIDQVNWIEDNNLENDVKLVLTVHDANIFQIRDSLIPEAIPLLRSKMLQWNSLGVPLGVDVEIGPNWGNLKKLEEVIA